MPEENTPPLTEAELSELIDALYGVSAGGSMIYFSEIAVRNVLVALEEMSEQEKVKEEGQGS